MWIQVSMLSDQTALDYNDDPQVDLVADDDQPYRAVIKPYERLMFEDSTGLVVYLTASMWIRDLHALGTHTGTR